MHTAHTPNETDDDTTAADDNTSSYDDDDTEAQQFLSFHCERGANADERTTRVKWKDRVLGVVAVRCVRCAHICTIISCALVCKI